MVNGEKWDGSMVPLKLKVLQHEDFAVLDQFCAELLTYCL